MHLICGPRAACFPIQLFVGPDCMLAMKIGKLYAFLATALIFSSLLPILFLFLFLYAVIAYAVDKYLFLRLYRSPPPYSHTLISSTLLRSSG